ERPMSARNVPSILLCCVIAVGCGGDEPVPVGDGSSDSSGESTGAGTTSNVDDGADETGSTGGADVTGGEAGDCAEYPLPFESDDHFLSQRENDGDAVVAETPPTDFFEDVCPIHGNDGAATAFYVYRPADTTGLDDWPDATIPVAVFVKAN